MTAPQTDYDLIMIGGGIGGCALAKVASEAGFKTLVLEKDAEYRDRVRGEVLVPWGGEDAKALGLYDLLHDNCAHEVRYWATGMGGMEVMRRDLVETVSTGLPVLCFYHPDMQRVVSGAAIDAGSEVLIGSPAKSIAPGSPPSVTFKHNGEEVTRTARLVIGADGRTSVVRKWLGMELERLEERRCFAGVLMEGIEAEEDTMYSRFDPDSGMMSWIFPQGGGRARTYIGFPANKGFKNLTGEKELPRFIETHESLGVPKECFANAKPVGPLATFDATAAWVKKPYRDGVVLIGDAASMTDPTWGQGMSHTMRDVRLLMAELTKTDDWNAAAVAYCVEHARETKLVRDSDTMYTDVFLDMGEEAEARRAQALPKILEDPTRIPDLPLAGPQCGLTDDDKRRFFGDD